MFALPCRLWNHLKLIVFFFLFYHWNEWNEHSCAHECDSNFDIGHLYLSIYWLYCVHVLSYRFFFMSISIPLFLHGQVLFDQHDSIKPARKQCHSLFYLSFTDSTFPNIPLSISSEMSYQNACFLFFSIYTISLGMSSMSSIVWVSLFQSQIWKWLISKKKKKVNLCFLWTSMKWFLYSRKLLTNRVWIG